MQVSDSGPQFSVKKFGFVVMAPIALVLHGLFLLIPLSPEQKAKEPDEKKEELQPIGSIAQLPPNIVAVASPTPKASPTPGTIAPAQQVTVPAQIVQSQQTPQAPSQQTPQPDPPKNTQPSPTPPKPDASPSPKLMLTTGDILLNSLNATVCRSAAGGCHTVPMLKDEILSNLAEIYEKPPIAFQDDNPDESHVAGYEVTNKKSEKEYIYLIDAMGTNKSGKVITITRVLTLTRKITDPVQLRELGVGIN